MLRRRAPRNDIATLLFGLSLILHAGPPVLLRAQEASDPNDPSSKTLPAWTWVENCHVQRGHQLTDFVSVGALLQKPLPGRDHDALQAALAWGHAALRDGTLVEVGYSLHVTDGLTLTPLVQVIADPAQNPEDDTFVLAGLRAIYVF